MKVASESPTLLVLKQSALSQIIFGVVFVIVGIALIPALFTKGLVALVGLVFILIGVLMALFAKFLTLTIDKQSNKIDFKFKGLLGTKQNNTAIDQVSEVVIQENYSRSSSNSSANLNLTLIFYLKNGESIPLRMSSGSQGISINGLPINIFSGRNKQIEIGNKIASFIGVPFKDNRPPTFQEMMGAVGQMINKNQPQNPPTIKN